MTEYKTFDDYVRNVFKIESKELTHISPEEQKKKTVAITADELISIWNEIIELEAQIEKMKCCGNCEHFNFNEPNYCHKGVYRERQYVCSEWEFGN